MNPRTIICAFLILIFSVGSVLASGETELQSDAVLQPTAQNAVNAAIIVPPIVAASFGAGSVPLNGTSSLTFTITNPNISSTLTGISLTDWLPAGLVFATPLNLSRSCGGVVSYGSVQGKLIIVISSVSLAAGGSCTLVFDVTGITLGTITTVTENITSVEGGTGGKASASINIVNVATLSIGFAGSGSGTVTSTSTDTAIKCIKGALGGCSVDYMYGTEVSLTATGSNSTFNGWTWPPSGSSGLNPYSYIIDGNRSITAIFTADPARVRIESNPSNLYYTVGDAFVDPTQDVEIRALAAPDFIENITMTSDHNILLRGGFTASDFSDVNRTGYSIIDGWLKIQSGKLAVEQVKIK